jgi:hypothetical protein
MPKEYAVKDIAVLKKVHHNKKNSNTDSVSEKELRALED